MSRWLLSTSEDGDSTSSLDNLCQHRTSYSDKVVSFVLRKVCLDLLPLPVITNTGKILKPSTDWTVPALSHSLYIRYSISFIILETLCWTFSIVSTSFVLQSPQLPGTGIDTGSPVLNREERSLLQTCCSSKKELDISTIGMNCWLVVCWYSPQTQVLSCKQLSIPFASSTDYCTVLLLSRGPAFHFP